MHAAGRTTRPAVCLAALMLVCWLGPAIAAGDAGGGPDTAALQSELRTLRALAKQQPRNVAVQLKLGMTLHMLNQASPDGGKRLPEAEAAYRAALDAMRGQEGSELYVNVLGNLGALLLASNQPDEAILVLQDALEQTETQPEQPQKNHQQQQQQQQQQRSKQSGQQQQKQQQGGALAKLRGGLLFNLGKALSTVGRMADADAAYAAAAAAAAGSDLGSYGKALAAARVIDTATAAQAARVAAAARAHWGAASPALAFLRDTPPPLAGDGGSTGAGASVAPQAGAAEQQLDWIREAESVDLVWLHFALHKHHHRAGQYDTAWAYLELGNRIMAVHVQYDEAVDRSNLGAITSIFTAPFMTGGHDDASAIFVVGMPRSGSTLVEQMLASHSQVFAAGEDTALAPLTPEVNAALADPSADHAAALRRFGKRYARAMRKRVPSAAPHSRRRQQSDAEEDSSSSSGGSDGGSGGSDTSQQQVQPAALRWRPARIVDKMLRNLWLVGYIQLLLPRSCIVHVARHPLDVALSCYAQPFGYSASALAWSWDLGAIASQLEMSWALAEHWQAQLPGRLHTVLYEELVAQPEAVARRLLDACGLAWEPGVLDFQHTQRPVHTASMAQVREPLYASSIARWRVYEQQLAGLQQRLVPLIDRYERLLQQRLAAYGGAAGGDGGAGSLPADQRAAAAGSRDEL